MDPRPPRTFYQRDPVTLARALLGQRLVRQLTGDDGRVIRLAGLIVETEAYLGEVDRAAHTFGGRRTARNASMWGEAGHAYVYFTYGMHHCMNIVAGGEGDPVAALIRALEPTEGLDEMRRRRPKARRETDLASGPGKLCQALRINRDLDEEDLVSSERLWVEKARGRALAASRVVVGPRIGVSSAGEWAGRPLRFHVRGNAHVSRPR